MIPIENSIAGRVADIHHLLPQSGLFIVGEFFLPVHHQLMALPGATNRDIKTVESHVHALGQCRKLIRKLKAETHRCGGHCRRCEACVESAATKLRLDRVCLAAKIYGLDILAEDVEDETHNTTRFVILARKKNGRRRTRARW